MIIHNISVDLCPRAPDETSMVRLTSRTAEDFAEQQNVSSDEKFYDNASQVMNKHT